MSTSGSTDTGSLVFQTVDGAYYRIPKDQLANLRMSDSEVQAFLARTEQVSSGDVQGFAMPGMMAGGMMAGGMMPMVVMVPTGLARQHRPAVVRSWNT